MNRSSHDREKAVSRSREISARDRWTVFFWVIQAFIAFAICFLIVLRLSLPEIGRFRPEVEQWISTAIGQNISIGSLDAVWRGWTPELIIKDIRLPDITEGAPRIESLRIRIGLDPLAFWKVTGIRIKRISLSETALTIIRSPDGALRLSGIGAAPSLTKSGIEGLLPWLLRQSRVDMDSAHIRWRDEGNEDASFSMPDTYLSIRREGARYRILAMMHPRKDIFSTVSSPEAKGGLLSVIADIAVNPITLDWSGKAFFRAQDSELDWLPFLRDALAPLATSGVTDFGLWMFWNKGRIEQVRGDFSLRNLVLRDMNRNTAIHARHIDSPEAGNREVSDPDGEPTPLVGGQAGLPKEHACTSCMPADERILPPGVRGSLQLDRVGASDWRLQLRQFVLITADGAWSPAHARVEITWSQNAHGRLFKIRDAELESRNITLRLMGAGQWFDDASSPDLRVVMDFEHRKLDRLGRYLPTSLMENSLVEWLRRAFPKGRLTQGRILFRGRIADFPFDNGEGVFEVRARTSHETTLVYAESWPPIEELSTDILFSGRSLVITANDGFLYDTELERVIAEIPDILAETPVLTIDGQLVGALEKGFAFLREGPLADQYASRLAGIQGRGIYRIDLNIRHLLEKDAPVRTRGEITFLNSTLHASMPQVATPKANDSDITLTLDEVNGVLRFDENGIAGRSIAARYSDRPIMLDIKKATDRENTTEFSIKNLDTDTLFSYPLLKNALRKMPPSLRSFATRVARKATWRTILDLPDDWGKSNRAARLRIMSPLRGANVNLPPPLTGRPFQVEMFLEPGNRQAREESKGIRFRFGTEATGIFSPEHGKRGRGKWRGAIRLGKGPVTLPKKGIRIDGHISRFSFEEWRALFGTRLDSTRASPLQGMPNLRAAVSFDEFTLFSRTLQGARFKIVRGGDGVWHIQIRSDALQGHIRIPRSGTNETVAVALTHLHLPLAKGEDEAHDFGDIPPMRITCEKLTYDARSLGAVKLLELAPNSQGLEVKRIEVASENFQIQGHGKWEKSGHSRFHIEIGAPDLGKLLSSFGYEGNVAKRGETYLELDARWPGSPMQFDLERMRGTLDVEVIDGRLLAIEPGAPGRVFGLLSITLLPRRLVLDFSDVFQEGLVYDKMEGKFEIHEGKAETSNFFVEGPTSRIDIAGSTGLIDKDYDQIATVVPKFSSTIPLAAIGIAQKLLDSPFFDEIFTYQYTIGGTWDDPEIEFVKSHEEQR
uniref:TIGR02099 family protein n=1 Tax=Candidatus Kentrum sp. UNK TaxID=2126344 RepID=A0A451A7I5_9GAMM|nr:MAG: TIGR02099 family protein [Candidatus Kentron sp. UNK]VFK70327.1 MAG: TIGR02099 family protein [Candidatus Kentron sp. UNK]